MKLRYFLLLIADLILLPYRMARGRAFGPRQLLSWLRLRRDFQSCGHVIDIFRNHEYLFTVDRLQKAGGRHWLDVGSGAGPFVPHVLNRFPDSQLTVNDIDESALDAVHKHLEYLGFPSSRYGLDSRNLATTRVGKDDSEVFDACTLVSAIEHFPGSGDVDFLRGVWPFLKKGGKVIITAPALAWYEENNPEHYHGDFERRYDCRGVYGRLQQNGYRITRLVYLHHADTFLARSLAKTHENLNRFFTKWYSNDLVVRRRENTTNLLVSMLLVDERPDPGPSMIGVMVEMEKVARRGLDAVDTLQTPADFSLGNTWKTDTQAPIRIFTPCEQIHLDRGSHEGDFFPVPFFLFNVGRETVGDGNPYFLAAYLTGADGPRREVFRAPLRQSVAPGTGIHMNAVVPIVANQPFDLVFDVIRGDEYWQGEKGGRTVRMQVVVN